MWRRRQEKTSGCLVDSGPVSLGHSVGQEKEEDTPVFGLSPLTPTRPSSRSPKHGYPRPRYVSLHRRHRTLSDFPLFIYWVRSPPHGGGDRTISDENWVHRVSCGLPG